MAGLQKAAERLSHKEEGQRGLGMVASIVVESTEHRCKTGNSPAPKISCARNRMNHLPPPHPFPHPNLVSLLTLLFLFVLPSSTSQSPWNHLLSPPLPAQVQPITKSVILSLWFCSHVVPLLYPHCHCAISGSQNICTGQL